MALIGIHQAFENPMKSIIFSADFLGANAYQTFIRNGRSMKRREITQWEIDEYNYVILRDKKKRFVAHAPYSMNPCRTDKESRDRAVAIIREDLTLLGKLVGKTAYVLHPGSSLNNEDSEALDCLCDVIERVQDRVYNSQIAVEIMAGAGTQMLSSYSQIDYLLGKVDKYPNVTLCYDTCHVFGAGMDLFETLFRYMSKISVVHLNGSKAAFGSHVDRHSSIRNSMIDTTVISSLAMHVDKLLPEVPIILETPAEVQIDDFMFLKDLLKKNS